MYESCALHHVTLEFLAWRPNVETPADTQTNGSEEPPPPGSLRTGKCCWLYGLA